MAVKAQAGTQFKGPGFPPTPNCPAEPSAQAHIPGKSAFPNHPQGIRKEDFPQLGAQRKGGGGNGLHAVRQGDGSQGGAVGKRPFPHKLHAVRQHQAGEVDAVSRRTPGNDSGIVPHFQIGGGFRVGAEQHVFQIKASIEPTIRVVETGRFLKAVGRHRFQGGGQVDVS